MPMQPGLLVPAPLPSEPIPVQQMLSVLVPVLLVQISASSVPVSISSVPRPVPSNVGTSGSTLSTSPSAASTLCLALSVGSGTWVRERDFVSTSTAVPVGIGPLLS